MATLRVSRRGYINWDSAVWKVLGVPRMRTAFSMLGIHKRMLQMARVDLRATCL